MGIVVAQCFVGPFSTVQCSTIPLPTNPIDGIMRKAISNLLSPATFLQSLANPDPKQAASTNSYQNMSSINENRATKKLSGIRYQRPTVIQALVQVLVHAIGGVLCAHLAIVPAMSQPEADNYNSTKMLISSSCS